MKYALSVDWFQYYCTSKENWEPVMRTYLTGKSKNPKGYVSQYYIDEPQEFHSLFAKGCTVKLHKFPLIHIHWKPKPSSLNKFMVSVKVANRLLYSSVWSFYLHDIIDALGLKIEGITRVDLACDIQKFAGDLLPNVFISRYLSSGDPDDFPQYIRSGSNNYCVHGYKKLIYEDTKKKEDVLGSIAHLDYLRFGSRNSGVSVYLYNKSQELKDKHSKPYIQKFWEDQGIIEDEELPVYRLELSINSKGMKIRPSGSTKADILRNPGLVRALATDDFSTQQAIEGVFWTYANKYFKFHVVGHQKYRKDMPVLQLWDFEVKTDMKPSFLSTAYDSGVAERRAAKTLERVLLKYPDLRVDEVVSMQKTADVLLLIGVIKQELSWFNKDGLGYLSGVNVHEWHDLQKAGCVSSEQYKHLQRLVQKAVSVEMEEFRQYQDYLDFCTERDFVEMKLEELDAITDEELNDYYTILSQEPDDHPLPQPIKPHTYDYSILHPISPRLS